LQEEALKLTPEIQTVTEKGKSLVPSLNEPDRQILADKLASLTTKLGTLSSNIGDKLTHLNASIKEFQQVSNIIVESVKYLNDVKAEVNNLNRPVGSAIEDSQGLLGSYEVQSKTQFNSSFMLVRG
jgi:ABC-type transporter Mla subunit MlaD